MQRSALECEGACPLFVDPGASTEGDGSSWTSPMRSVQAAIDAQANRGGGAVWVRAGGPSAALVGDPAATLIQLREGVAVFGGFSGTESNADARDPASRTPITGSPWGDDGDAAPLILGASNATLDGFSIAAHHGPALVIRDVTGVRVTNVAIEESWVDSGALIDVENSAARFERLRVSDTTGVRAVPGLRATGSTVSVVDSEFARGLIKVEGNSAAIAATSSTLMLDGVWLMDNRSGTQGKAAGLSVTGSEVLAVDSVWLRNRGDRGTLSAVDSRFVAVNSHWESNGSIAAPVALRQGSDATFLNASFVSNVADSYGTIYANASQLEIVSSTFVDNRVTYPTRSKYPDDVGFDATAPVAIHDVYSNRGQYSVYGAYAGSGNCLLLDSAPHRETVGGLTRALLRPELGCADTGDDAAAATATERASLFASSLDATLPLGAIWWSTLSSVLGVATDSGTIDPGRHY